MNTFSRVDNKLITQKNHRSKAIAEKVEAELTSHVFRQLNFAMMVSFSCALIVMVGLYVPEKDNTALYIWSGLFLGVTIFRTGLGVFFRRDQMLSQHVIRWNRLYILGAVLSGICWGLAGIVLFPLVRPDQQMLLVLVVAGVTAGVTSLASAIPAASISFLVLTLVPYMVVLALLKNFIYLMFDITVLVYLIYSIYLTIRTFQIIKTAIELRFENELLFMNLSEAKQQLEFSNKILSQAATHDALTQLANRNLFQLNLEKAIQYAKNDQKKLALLYLDLDRFKLVNDIYGHEVGDQLLITVTERLKHFFHSSDLLARLGGDEFTVILENVAALDEVKEIAAQICQLIAMPFRINNIGLKVSASIGISFYSRGARTARDMTLEADNAMYYAKEHGGNNYYYEEKTLEKLERRT